MCADALHSSSSAFIDIAFTIDQKLIANVSPAKCFSVVDLKCFHIVDTILFGCFVGTSGMMNDNSVDRIIFQWDSFFVSAKHNCFSAFCGFEIFDIVF